MLARFIKHFLGRSQQPSVAQEENEQAAFAELNRDAPLRHSPARPPVQLPIETPPTILCREAVLSRDQRIAGYNFMLQEGGHGRIRAKSRRIAHLCSEILVTRLVAADIGRLLGPRLAFIEVPDSFLGDPCLATLPRDKCVILPRAHADKGAPDVSDFMDNAHRLQTLGLRIGFPDPLAIPEFAGMVGLADIIWLKARALDASHDRQLHQLLETRKDRPPTLLVRGLESLDHFRYCFNFGVHYFQGPFITSREDWSENVLAPRVARVSALISRLRADAGIEELAGMLKEDPAISLRLLRFINCAAFGLPERVSSIERAIALIGRERLYRWLVLVAFGTEGSSGRTAAVLETALVRARMMELAAENCPSQEQDSIFLVGLLSLADVIMRMPLDKALAPLAVAPDIQESLCGEGRWRPYLDLAIACERGGTQQIGELAERCGVSPEQASDCHLSAFHWAIDILAESSSALD
ncbi:MAG: HDOD domain-containing protein [Rhodocyclaceae bacterium]|nr:HDOD domain-containing protein [Rhodocyclaceae bacterium]MBX3666825.1 HDOD domain-containing protein [Rhodocyclaceae bacterium]